MPSSPQQRYNDMHILRGGSYRAPAVGTMLSTGFGALSANELANNARTLYRVGRAAYRGHTYPLKGLLSKATTTGWKLPWIPAGSKWRAGFNPISAAGFGINIVGSGIEAATGKPLPGPIKSFTENALIPMTFTNPLAAVVFGSMTGGKEGVKDIYRDPKTGKLRSLRGGFLAGLRRPSIFSIPKVYQMLREIAELRSQL